MRPSAAARPLTSPIVSHLQKHRQKNGCCCSHRTQPAQSPVCTIQAQNVEAFPESGVYITLYLRTVEKGKPAAHVLRGLHEIRAQQRAPCCFTLYKRFTDSYAEECLGAEQRKQRLAVEFKKRDRKKKLWVRVDSVSAISVVFTEVRLEVAVICSVLSEMKNVPARRQSKSAPVCVCVFTSCVGRSSY